MRRNRHRTSRVRTGRRRRSLHRDVIDASRPPTEASTANNAFEP